MIIQENNADCLPFFIKFCLALILYDNTLQNKDIETYINDGFIRRCLLIWIFLLLHLRLLKTSTFYVVLIGPCLICTVFSYWCILRFFSIETLGIYRYSLLLDRYHQSGKHSYLPEVSLDSSDISDKDYIILDSK